MALVKITDGAIIYSIPSNREIPAGFRIFQSNARREIANNSQNTLTKSKHVRGKRTRGRKT